MRIINRSYLSCPLIEEIHIQNVLGGCEKRQWLFGGRVSIGAGVYTKAVTFTSLTGGLVTVVDHSQIFAQKLNAAPVNKTFVTSKTGSGFTLNGDPGALYSILVLATLPTYPRATPKWAKDYCPYCKNLGFDAVIGSSLKDIAAFSGIATTSVGGTVAVAFPTLTATSGAAGVDRGSQKASLVTMMYDNEYQIILTPLDTAVTSAPYPSSITVDGFTLNGDASKSYDIFILGQIRF